MGRSRQGFSLVELVVALALFGLLLAVAVPAIGAWIGSMRVRATAESILGGLQLARIEAAKRNQDVIFFLDSAAGGAWHVADQAGNNIQTRAATEAVTYVGVLPAANSIPFTNLGQLDNALLATPGQGFTISVSSSSDNCQPGGPIRCLDVTVSFSGEPRLCDPLLNISSNPQGC
jgi:type IV fimbrial biogenesis protein FimT